ncbi:phage tail fiber domain-containing protein [Citrobacter sp. CK205]|uniref:phage tail fiber domain-containing protein n=1 Tax=Citrobacter sp. CK205 TaxID=2985114 RepID=UPI002575D554|nr:phage tail fiber protein [Citrobacter sp. CK205]MDM3130088.1 phage tail fiber protein [Citrobacter sp. CK205]
MSVPNQTPYIIYNANGLTTVFPFEFYVISASDIQVTFDGVEVTTGYSVSGVGNVSGGDVVFVTPPAAGTVVMIERVVPTYRLTDYQDNGDLLADTVNKDFDRLWMAIQRYGIHLGLSLRRPLFGGPFNAEGFRIANGGDPVDRQDFATKNYVDNVSLVRAIRVPESSVSALPPVEQRANKLLAFNSSGNPIAVVPPSGSASDVLIELAKPTGAMLVGATDSDGNETTVQEALDEKQVSIGTTNVVYSSSFKSNDEPYIQIAISIDGKNFTSSFIPSSYDPSAANYDNKLWGRDPSIIWHDGFFYVAVTGYAVGSHDFIIWRSPNLTDWEHINCKLGSTPVMGRYVGSHPVAVARVWAPELMIINNELVVAVSLNCEENTTDKNGSSVSSFRPFWSICTDVNTLTFSEPVEFNMPSELNRIDPDIMYDDKIHAYVMVIKNEIQKYIEIFTATEFSGAYEFVGVAPFSNDCEGPSLLLLPDGSTRLYADFYTATNGIRYMDTLDYLSWGEEGIVSTAPMRHGTFRNTSGDARELLALLRASALAPVANDGLSVTMEELPAGAVTITPQNGCVYWVGGSNVSQLTLNPGGKHFFIAVRSSLSSAAIVIQNTIYGVETVGYGDVNRFYELVLDSRTKKYSLLGMGGTSTVINLVTDAGSQNINSSSITWRPKRDWTYQTSGNNSGATTINALPTDIPGGFKFYLRVDSSTANGRIILKGGGAGFNFVNDITIDGSAGLDGRLIEVRRVGNGFSVMAF